MHTVSLSDFRANAAEIIDQVAAGRTVRILRHGKPVAELVPVRADAATRVPNWKLPFEPVKVTRPDGRTGAQLIIEEREGAW
jgi:prevent-host-death family protein